MNFGDALVIAGDQTVENFREPHPRAPVDPPHDAEIDRGEAAVGQGEQIALVKVGVEEAVDHRLAQEGADEDGGERLGVMPGLDQLVALRELDAVDPFERQHPLGGPRPVDLGDVKIGLGDHLVLELGRRGGLALEVEFAPRPLLEMGDDEPRTEARGLAAEPLDMCRGPFVCLERAGEFLLDPGAEHLDRNGAAFERHRLVNLRDRGGADGHRIDRLEQLFDRGLERLLDRRLDRREGQGRQRILQPHEVRRGIATDQIGTSRERLPQLDRGGADRLQRGGVIGHGGLAQTEARGPEQVADRGRGQRIALDPPQRAVPGERPPPFEEPIEVGNAGGQIFQPL